MCFWGEHNLKISFYVLHAEFGALKTFSYLILIEKGKIHAKNDYPYFQMRIEMLHKHFNKSNLFKYTLKLEIGQGINPYFIKTFFWVWFLLCTGKFLFDSAVNFKVIEYSFQIQNNNSSVMYFSQQFKLQKYVLTIDQRESAHSKFSQYMLPIMW